MDTNAKLYQDMTKILVKREDIQKAVAQARAQTVDVP